MPTSWRSGFRQAPYGCGRAYCSPTSVQLREAERERSSHGDEARLADPRLADELDAR